MSPPALWMSAVMLLAGIGIPVMAALNGALGARIGPPAAAVTLFTVAFTCALAAMVATGGASYTKLTATPVYLFAGGLFVAFYVLAITMLAPRMGVATAVLFVLLGQIVSAALIDHFGLLGAPQSPITLPRAIGLFLMVVGIYLARRPG